MIGVLIRKQKRESGGEGPSCGNEAEIGVCSYKSSTPRIVSNHQRLDEAKKDAPLQISERTGLC